MSKVTVDISMSLDGFVARPDDDPGPIQDWLFNGDTVNPHNDFFKTAGASTDVLNEYLETTGVIVAGRRTLRPHRRLGRQSPGGRRAGVRGDAFAAQHGAGRAHVLHVRRRSSGGGRAGRARGRRQDVSVMGGASVARQRLLAGLLDDVQIHLTPVLLGQGIRLIDDLEGTEVSLEQTRVLEAPGVTLLRYRVLK